MQAEASGREIATHGPIVPATPGWSHSGVRPSTAGRGALFSLDGVVVRRRTPQAYPAPAPDERTDP